MEHSASRKTAGLYPNCMLGLLFQNVLYPLISIGKEPWMKGHRMKYSALLKTHSLRCQRLRTTVCTVKNSQAAVWRQAL